MSRRPFAATPQSNCFVPTEGMKAAFDSLVMCARSAQGIGIVTGAAGLGKSLLCERIALELKDDFTTILLRNGQFSSWKALLQSALYELREPYQQLDESELRLALDRAVRSLRPKKNGLLLIIDEADQLTVPMLQELRSLCDIADAGHSLVRMILSGQVDLDETLSEPPLEALRQRIGCQVVLEPLTRQQSFDYITHRLQWADADVATVFTPEALEQICIASDGVPRCLNQLCDHCLLLAYVAEGKAVDAGTVAKALYDLKQLPLHWNEFVTNDSSNDEASEKEPMDPLCADESSQGASVELDANSELDDFECDETDGEFASIEVGADIPLDSQEQVDGTESNKCQQAFELQSATDLASSCPDISTTDDDCIPTDIQLAVPSAASHLFDLENLPTWSVIAPHSTDLSTPEIHLLVEEKWIDELQALHLLDMDLPRRIPLCEISVSETCDSSPSASPLQRLDEIEPLLADALDLSGPIDSTDPLLQNDVDQLGDSGAWPAMTGDLTPPPAAHQPNSFVTAESTDGFEEALGATVLDICLDVEEYLRLAENMCADQPATFSDTANHSVPDVFVPAVEPHLDPAVSIDQLMDELTDTADDSQPAEEPKDALARLRIESGRRYDRLFSELRRQTAGSLEKRQK